MGKQFTAAMAYGFLTPLFDWFVNLLGYGKAFKKMVLELSEIDDGQEILDVGCGSGTLLLEMGTRYPHSDLTGVDPDMKILKLAAKKLERAGSKATLIQGFAQELPFPQESFDFVISTLNFHHMSASVKRDASGEIHRILKKTGRFMLADLGKPKHAVTKLLLGSRLNPDARANMKDNIEGRLPALLQESGFKVKELETRHRGVQFWLATK